ncbi:TAXI family TRAP transporter solute-binding subunit [Isoptericola cucumis]|uniref:C4-dicarboxylate ABC transporter substrate-binding protein n=1 Tax=Isoptericola cucumis TaxID=1776856 RepID=A0ABQ2B604_9MICO|nr:TAXI family TRAP transporter solute-binding subunit [Isoptericola cucumis]GGI07446.1 C4-dicarboxylate ABC transporter substrate-binding protein [Isoptericola cucumis]
MVLAVVAVLVVVRSMNDRGGDPWEGSRPDSLVVTTGGTSGIYHGYGVAVGDVLSQEQVPVDVLDSGGSVENLQRVADGTAQLGFSAADAVADAVAGRGAFDEPLPLCALARVYDDFVHLVVREDSPVRTIEDLAGRTVSLGAPRSGTALIAHRLLDAAGVEQDDLDGRSLGLAESIDALRSGDVDAFFWSGGLRTPGIDRLAESAPVRLVPLGEIVEDVRARHGSGYRHGVVPQGMYGSTEEVATLAVPNFLVVRADMPDPVARMLVTTLFDARSQVARTVPAAAHLDRARAIFTEPLDLHPGAMEYYRETKS